MTQTQHPTAASLNQLIGPAALHPPPTTASPIQAAGEMLRVEDAIFTPSDVEIIGQVGATTWAMRKEIARWDDMPLNWKALPGLLRSTILADVVETLNIPIRYAVPFRHVGRVLTIAILLAEREPIRVRQAGRPAVSDEPEQIIFRDPPVPFLTLGLAPRGVQEQHARMVRQVLQGESGSLQIAPAHLSTLLLDIARTGEATCSEMFYYLTQLRALVSGAWRQVWENYGVLAVEYLARQSDSNHPLQPQLLAEAHLVEGRPIDWGDDGPLRITTE